jgi:hypothetical protein
MDLLNMKISKETTQKLEERLLLDLIPSSNNIQIGMIKLTIWRDDYSYLWIFLFTKASKQSNKIFGFIEINTFQVGQECLCKN